MCRGIVGAWTETSPKILEVILNNLMDPATHDHIPGCNSETVCPSELRIECVRKTE
jgi:hypothetical protein